MSLKVNTIDDGKSYYTNCTEYRVITTDGQACSWSGVDQAQVQRDFFERGRLIQSIQVYAEWEAEQKRLDAEQEYRVEIEKAAANTGKEVA